MAPRLRPLSLMLKDDVRFDHAEARHLAQRRDQLAGEAVGKVLVGRVAARGGKWKHRDGPRRSPQPKGVVLRVERSCTIAPTDGVPGARHEKHRSDDPRYQTAFADKAGRTADLASDLNVVEHAKDFAGTRRPRGTVLREQARDQRGERRRKVRATNGERLGFFRHDRRDELRWRTSREWRRAGEDLVGEHSERVEVRTLIDRRVRGDLLRRHVGRRSK